MIAIKLHARAPLVGGVIIAFALLMFVIFLFYVLFTSKYTVFVFDLDSHIYGLLKFTLFQAFLSTAFSLLVGIFLAWALMHRSRFRGRSLLVALFSSSLVLPTLLVAFGIIGIFGGNGWLNRTLIYLFDVSMGSYIYGLTGILIAHVYLNASFASMALLHGLEAIPEEKYKLSKSLGFSVWKRFWYVEFPALGSTIFNIGVNIFLLCFTSFAIVLLLGGSPSYNTLEVAIYEAIRLDFNIGMALKLALIQLGISAILVVLTSGFRTDVANLKVYSRHSTWKSNGAEYWIQNAIIWLFGLFFISPLLVIFVDGVGADFDKLLDDDIFIKSLATSIFFATVSSTIVVLASVFLGDFMRNLSVNKRGEKVLYYGILRAMVLFLSNIYLAVPSLVLGLGFFLISLRYDTIVFTWSSIALVFANVLMSLPFSVSVIAPMMQKTQNRYGRLCSSLGLSTVQKWMYADYPYLKSSLGYVLALAFCFSLGDLGIIALFGSDEFTTLPWYLYRLMGSYRNEDAAGVALILLVLVLAVFVVLPKIFGGIDAKNN